MGNNYLSTTKLQSLLAPHYFLPSSFQQSKAHSSYQGSSSHALDFLQLFTHSSFNYNFTLLLSDPNLRVITFSFSIRVLTSHLVPSFLPDFTIIMPTKLLSQATNNQRQMASHKSWASGPSLAWSPRGWGAVEYREGKLSYNQQAFLGKLSKGFPRWLV